MTYPIKIKTSWPTTFLQSTINLNCGPLFCKNNQAVTHPLKKNVWPQILKWFTFEISFTQKMVRTIKVKDFTFTVKSVWNRVIF